MTLYIENVHCYWMAYTSSSHCAIDGTAFGCDGGGRCGGQFGALTPGFFGGGFFWLALGAGTGWVLVSVLAGAAVGGVGAWNLGGAGGLTLEN